MGQGGSGREVERQLTGTLSKRLAKSLRVFRVGKAEHHEVAVITAQGARQLR
jgi:hypothetical protein